MKIVVEGWRFIARSHAILSEFEMLEMLKRPEIELFHQDLPYAMPSWQPVTGLFDPENEAKLKAIPSPPPNLIADATWRVSYPFDFRPSSAQRTCVFGTTEWGIVHNTAIRNNETMQTAFAHSDTIIVTTSNWSRNGFLRSGADPNRVVSIPLGIDPNIYKPLTEPERIALRRQLGWEGCFIFLNIGVMLNNKGMSGLLKGFAAIAAGYPQARLVLKGTDSLFASKQALTKMLQFMQPDQREKMRQKLGYIGENLSFQQLAQLYQAADAYVSPYLAEGFNMPVLEAIACGLPVICTKGGSTDDFTHPDFALAIESQPQKTIMNDEVRFFLQPNLDHLICLMETVMEKPDFVARARQTGPQFVADRLTWKHIVDQLLAVLVPSHHPIASQMILPQRLDEPDVGQKCPKFEPIIF